MNQGGANYTPAFKRHVSSNYYGAVQPWGYPSDYSPYSSGYVPENTPNFASYNPTPAPSYGRSINQSGYHSTQQYPCQQEFYTSTPYVNYNQFYQTPNYFIAPSYPSPYTAANPCPTQPLHPSNLSEVNLHLPTYTGVLTSSKGLEVILIAILILVALDLILVRPQKLNSPSAKLP